MNVNITMLFVQVAEPVLLVLDELIDGFPLEYSATLPHPGSGQNSDGISNEQVIISSAGYVAEPFPGCTHRFDY